jgi:hypothetical protein
MRLACVSIAVVCLASLPGCALPHGPLNLRPLVPGWLRGEGLECGCAADLPLSMPVSDSGAINPPYPKFHPVPTRPALHPPSL